jgi:hypothetical protein
MVVSTRSKRCRVPETVQNGHLPSPSKIVQKTLKLAQTTSMTHAIAFFTQQSGHNQPFDFLLLHAAAAVSLKEFENCLRLYSMPALG